MPFNTCLEDNKAEALRSMHLWYCPGLRMLVIKVQHHINDSICQRASTYTHAHTHTVSEKPLRMNFEFADQIRPDSRQIYLQYRKKDFRLFDDTSTKAQCGPEIIAASSAHNVVTIQRYSHAQGEQMVQWMKPTAVLNGPTLTWRLQGLVD